MSGCVVLRDQLRGDHLADIISLVFAILKSVILLVIWNFDPSHCERHRRHLRSLETFSKWPMLDVFVVARLVVLVKLGRLPT